MNNENSTKSITPQPTVPDVQNKVLLSVVKTPTNINVSVAHTVLETLNDLIFGGNAK